MRPTTRNLIVALAIMQAIMTISTLYIAWYVKAIYDAIPGLGPAELVALAGFNEMILREAFIAGLPVIDLRILCNQPSDYSHLSPIEPSMAGGSKIARVVAQAVTTHDFGPGKSVVYV